MGQRAVAYVVGVVLVAALALAAPASAQRLLRTTGTLPGSTFQGADGDQDDAAPLIDWQTLEDANRVQHNPDANDEDTVFAGGSKELKPGEWGLTTEGGGVNPAKANILDAWSAVDQPGADTFVYLGFTREASTGTTFLTFELNHDARLWDNGRARIPCRRTGDLLVSYEQLGNTVRVVIRRWTTGKSDPVTGCATTGQINTFRELKANTVGQAAMNDRTITSRLPGAFTGTVPAGHFGEAAINLSQLLEEAFGERCMAFNSVWMHSRSSDSETSQMKDYVAPQALDVWTCSASGTKFFDRDADGVRDSDDRGIPGFVIWADYDNDGEQDATEPYSISDDTGLYVIHDIRPPGNGTYRLRERLLGRRSRAVPIGVDWRCSYPNDSTPGGTGSAEGGRFGCAWGPFDADTEPNVQGRDFGNWLPAQLTLIKQLSPEDDPGRFDLLVSGRDAPVVSAAGDGASETVYLKPGTYTVSERAVPPTDPAAYDTDVWCQAGANRLRAFQAGVTSETVSLLPGETTACTFYNQLRGAPEIAIRKLGPSTAEAGETLPYRLVVRNTGDVFFRRRDVQVTDRQCDDPPRRVATPGDETPRTLDPGDRWIYRCSHKTAPPEDDCEPTSVPNRARVTGTANGDRVSDAASIRTIILCPDDPVPPVPPDPVPPDPVPPDPVPPDPVVPPGPPVPSADDAGTAGLIFRRTIQECIGSRVPRVHLQGVRISRVRIYVNGVFIRGLTLRVLQRRLRPRVTLAPGQRYRLRVRVTFQRGTDSPPVTLRAVFRTCARPPVACPSAVGEPGARVACAAFARRRD